MEHYNPLLTGLESPEKFITVGEIMLRLTPPNYEKIRMTSTFEASYGGSEANIALALANLGVDSTFFSVVPNNSLGKSAIRMLRSNDVHCTPVILSTPEQTPTHRLGSYYLETGYGIRASKVTYDRKNSAITEFDFDRPCAVVIGNEGKGLPKEHSDICKNRVTISMHGNIESLNAACAGTIILWEMFRGGSHG